MSKRRYTNMVALLPVIEGMLAAGMSQREIEEELGLEGDRPVHNLLKRERRRRARGIPPKQKGRPRTRPLTTVDSCQKEIRRLEMENKLLRDFLQSTERM